MTITRVTDGNTAAATDLNQLINLMEGSESIDFLLMSLAATDFKIRLADAGGARKFIIQDSTGATVAYIDSDGNASFTSVALSTLVVPTSAAPAQTTDGSVVWDSDDNYLTVGDGTSRKQFQSDNAGSNIASASTLTVTDRKHRVTGTTTITAISTMPAGFHLTLDFAGAVQLTHSTALRLAGSANYTTTAEETLYFVSDGSGNWREVGRKPQTVTTPGLTLVGSDTTERSTSSTTAADLSTISGLSISTATPIEIHFSFRKTAGAAAEAAFGLKLNSTVVQLASTSSATDFTGASNGATSGYAVIRIGPREASYLRSAMCYAASDDFGGDKVFPFSSSSDMPTATITSITITGIVGSASITAAIKNVRVYTLATS